MANYNARMRERGFSLVELLVALMILTLVITSSLAVFVERRKRLQQAQETVLVYQALANEAEFRRRVPFEKLDDMDASFHDVAVLEPLKPYGTAIKVENVKPHLKRVTLTVRWHDGQRNARLMLLRADMFPDQTGDNLW
ncbi:MAG TPA: type II secretion system protein [Thermoanaerobaculia bacterium]|nr:type II secretion system protein [Thermoanaerobaculia bacterium]